MNLRCSSSPRRVCNDIASHRAPLEPFISMTTSTLAIVAPVMSWRSAVDPQLGAVFYTLDQKNTDEVQLLRQTGNCLVCHSSSRTDGVPGTHSTLSFGIGKPYSALSFACRTRPCLRFGGTGARASDHCTTTPLDECHRATLRSELKKPGAPFQVNRLYTTLVNRCATATSGRADGCSQPHSFCQARLD